jgi:lipoprotein-releasing system ATP-binding protein
MSQPVLEAIGLAKRYPSGAALLTVLEDVSFQLQKGESVALVGESGAGKSTLLHLLGALDTPTEGRILFGDLVVNEAGEKALDGYRNSAVGYVWQSYHLLPEFTALENVIMPRLIAGESREQAAPRGLKWLERVGLAGRSTHRSGELSGGEQQRVAVARALVGNPKLLLADEPTGNLDDRASEELIAQLFELQRSEALTMVIATHNISFARRCDRVYRIANAALIAA